MKNERRHQLERNELAERLGSGIQSAHGIFPYLLGGLAIVVVGFIAWGAYSANVKRKASLAWTEFYFNLASGNADAYADLARDYPGTAAAGWARQIAGDNYLQRGIESLYRDKSEGQELIEQAIEEFEVIVDTARNDELRTRALFGLGQAHESLGNLDEAAGYYEQVNQSSALPALAREAAERLSFLSGGNGKEFYAWFSKLNPQPDAPIRLSDDLALPPMGPDGGLQFSPPPQEPPADPSEQLDPGDLPELPELDFGPSGDIEAARSPSEAQ